MHFNVNAAAVKAQFIAKNAKFSAGLNVAHCDTNSVNTERRFKPENNEEVNKHSLKEAAGLRSSGRFSFFFSVFHVMLSFHTSFCKLHITF